MAARLSEVLGQQVIVENLAGAGGMTGANRVAKARPDGYTVLLASSSVLAENQSLYKKPLYNAATDFAPVSLIADFDYAQEPPGQHACGIHRLRESPPGDHAICLRRRRLRAAHLRRVAEHGDGHEHHPCPLSWQRARPAGPSRP